MQRIPRCLLCDHYIGDNNPPEDKTGTILGDIFFYCKAFPSGEGIPDIFEMGFRDECANGISFKREGYPKS